jgi:hypothetical protein
MAPLNSDDADSRGAPHSPNLASEGPVHPQTIPDIFVVVQKRPRYSVQIDETVQYCQNFDAVKDFLAQKDRLISTGDVYNALKIAPHSKYRLLERLNGANITKIPPRIPN